MVVKSVCLYFIGHSLVQGGSLVQPLLVYSLQTWVCFPLSSLLMLRLWIEGFHILVLGSRDIRLTSVGRFHHLLPKSVVVRLPPPIRYRGSSTCIFGMHCYAYSCAMWPENTEIRLYSAQAMQHVGFSIHTDRQLFPYWRNLVYELEGQKWKATLLKRGQ